MFLLRLIAQSYILIRRIWRRGKMILLRPAFKRYGRHFIFDPDSFYSFKNIEVGNDVSVGGGAFFLASKSRIIIGNKVLFGPNVTIVGGNHNTSVPFQFMYDMEEKRPEDDQDVVIEDDVWVGTGVIILKGVRVGRGSVIAAGAVVIKNVPPYTVAAGVPAKPIRGRFPDLEIILAHEEKLYPPKERLSRDQIYPH